MRKTKYLIHLDCLLDTVLGTVYKMDKDLVYPLLSKGYFSRNHNCLHLLHDKIDKHTFNELYINRDVETLKLSRRTNTFVMLSDIISESVYKSEDHPLAETYEVTINVYPYKLSKDESETLIDIIATAFNLETVTLISKSVKELTVKYVKENFSRVLFYGIHEWITEVKYYSKQLVETPIPNIICEGPIIGREEVLGGKVQISKNHSVPYSDNLVKMYTIASFRHRVHLMFVSLSEVSLYIGKIDDTKNSL